MANTDDDNRSELTDDDKLEGAQYPPDRPLGAEDRGANDGEDSVVERMRREIPDRSSRRGEGDVGQLADPTPGVDDEADAVAVEAKDERDVLGRDTAAQDLGEVQPAEEAAMHITEEPPMGDGDGYVD